jgi:hypothetical protein
MRSQQDIDSIYSDWCTIIKENMYNILPFKKINFSHKSNKKRRPGKAWWSDRLTVLWTRMSTDEKNWLKCTHRSEKIRLKSIYVTSRKLFDREVQKAKRFYWYSLQNDLLNDCKVDSTSFWKSIGKIGVGFSKTKPIPMEVILPNGELSTNVDDVLFKWKHDFSSLFQNVNLSNIPFNVHNIDSVHEDNLIFNDNISILEVKKAIESANLGKACGSDNIPVEVLKNDTSVYFLHVLFNACFNTGVIPTSWGKTVINPIPKSSTADPRDPLSYRGIALSSAMYKLYCSILNSRLSSWAEDNNKLHDEQNGFRRKRSTLDHISSLSSIVETRIKHKLSTFTAFIDFKKAYDFINRDMLWMRLQESGISGKMHRAISSLYSFVSSSVRVNSLNTDWFEVRTGLRQGCILSPLLFNLYINDLITYLKSFNVGIDIEGEKICILLYADDIVLLAENSNDLQCLLNALNDWCSVNDMTINCEKSKVVHFRHVAITRCNTIFTCGNDIFEIVDRYKYLGLILTEHLDFNITAKHVAQSAGRALGLVIAKCKSIGGVPYAVYTKLYDSIVWPVINYGAAVWGDRSFSCVNAVHNKALRFFLGVGKYTPNAALAGEMAWQPPVVRQWKSIFTFWARLSNTNSSRLNKRIALWAHGKANNNCKTWYFRVKSKLFECRLSHFYDISNYVSKHAIVDSAICFLMDKYVCDWKQLINRSVGSSGRGRNKLRTYCTFKKDYSVENYCTMIMPPLHRSAFCKFRCGVAPIRLETGRYENLSEQNRTCPFCVNNVESESHVILQCSLYDDYRRNLFHKAAAVDPEFYNKSDNDKLVFLFTNTSLIRICAKTCFDILNRRKSYLCK